MEKPTKAFARSTENITASTQALFVMEKNYKHIAANGNIYYFNSNGVRVKSKFISIRENGSTNVYYFGKSGKAYRGWHTIKGKKYYFYQGNRNKCRSACTRH